MSAKEKIRTFFSIYGPITLGLVLLFVGSTWQSSKKMTRHSFPVAGYRTERGVGGDSMPTSFPMAQPTVPLLKNVSSTFTGTLTAAAAVVVDDTSNAVLFNKNGDAVRPLASISKLMSALVLMDLPITWASSTVITDSDWDGDSNLVLVGEKYTLEDLWHVGLIGSSNTAINALARNSTVTTTQFIALMNKKAEDLHLTTASFVEPTGLSSQNVASALDAAALLKEAVRRDKIYKALHTAEYYSTPLNAGAKQRRVWSTDWLLTRWIPSDFDADNIVGKTGYIDDSLYNFAVRLTDARGHSLRVVVLGAASNDARFTEARDLADWVFGHYVWPNDPGYQSLTQ